MLPSPPYSGERAFLLPSPRVLRGRGAGGEGAGFGPRPPHPQPLAPEYGGEGLPEPATAANLRSVRPRLSAVSPSRAAEARRRQPQQPVAQPLQPVLQRRAARRERHPQRALAARPVRRPVDDDDAGLAQQV